MASAPPTTLRLGSARGSGRSISGPVTPIPFHTTAPMPSFDTRTFELQPRPNNSARPRRSSTSNGATPTRVVRFSRSRHSPPSDPPFSDVEDWSDQEASPITPPKIPHVVRRAVSVESSDASSSLGAGDEGDGLIPKPQGEVGRPGRGGYNLQEELGWSKQTYFRVNVSSCIIAPWSIANATLLPGLHQEAGF